MKHIMKLHDAPYNAIKKEGIAPSFLHPLCSKVHIIQYGETQNRLTKLSRY